MTKEQMTERLQELAVILGREADISGSKADIEQRLAEWEEEAECIQEHEETSRIEVEEEPLKNATEYLTGRVRVRMKVTAHLEALDEYGERRVEFATAGRVVCVEKHLCSGLITAGIAEACDVGEA